MDLRECRRVILFGGSFDPPHVAHVVLPVMAMQQTGADAVVYVPAGHAPHKLDRVQAPAHHRLAMLRLALETVSKTVILTDEIERGDNTPSFTVDTLTALRRRFPALAMRLLIGADMLRIFTTWREPARVIELAEPLVMVRPPDTKVSLLGSLKEGAERTAWEGRMIDLPQMDVSSSDIRERVAAGLPIDGMVAPAVGEYIRREGLYVKKER